MLYRRRFEHGRRVCLPLDQTARLVEPVSSELGRLAHQLADVVAVVARRVHVHDTHARSVRHELGRYLGRQLATGRVTVTAHDDVAPGEPRRPGRLPTLRARHPYGVKRERLHRDRIRLALDHEHALARRQRFRWREHPVGREQVVSHRQLATRVCAGCAVTLRLVTVDFGSERAS